MNGNQESPDENQANTPDNSSSQPDVNEPEQNQEVEKSQNDHLNRRLLCSFMEKLNNTQAEAAESSNADVEDENDEFEDA